jgi:hypothetical protein
MFLLSRSMGFLNDSCEIGRLQIQANWLFTDIQYMVKIKMLTII